MYGWCSRKNAKRLYLTFCTSSLLLPFFFFLVPTGSPSRGGYVVMNDFVINQLSLPTPFYSVLVSVYVFMALSTVFHSVNSPDNYPLSHSVFFRSYVCLTGPFNYISLYESLPQPGYNPLWLTRLKTPTNYLTFFLLFFFCLFCFSCALLVPSQV